MKSFVGIFQEVNPQYTCLVVFSRPQGIYDAGLTRFSPLPLQRDDYRHFPDVQSMKGHQNHGESCLLLCQVQPRG